MPEVLRVKDRCIQAQMPIEQLGLHAQLFGLREFRVEVERVVVHRMRRRQTCGPASSLVALGPRRVEHRVVAQVVLRPHLRRRVGELQCVDTRRIEAIRLRRARESQQRSAGLAWRQRISVRERRAAGIRATRDLVHKAIVIGLVTFKMFLLLGIARAHCDAELLGHAESSGWCRSRRPGCADRSGRRSSAGRRGTSRSRAGDPTP